MATSWACNDHEISADEDWILHERVFLTREWMEPKAPGQLPFERGEAREVEATFTLSDLVTLLRDLPSPGEDYLAAVEEAVRTRQPVAKSPWET